MSQPSSAKAPEALVDERFFEALADRVCLPGPWRTALFLKAESSDFIRFNHAAVRQATHVLQGHATLSVAHGARRIDATTTLAGRLDDDARRLIALRDDLRSRLGELADDPHLLLPDATTRSHRHDTARLPRADEVIDAVATAARGHDFVGFHASGPVVRAFADSLGSRHWHHVETFHTEGCLYHAGDKAVKTALAGTDFDAAALRERIASAAATLPLLARPPKRLAPGEVRAWFAPVAFGELLGTLGWGGFSARARRVGTSALMRLARGEVTLSPSFSLTEDTAQGTAPAFTPDGFVKPARVPLIVAGHAGDTLNSPRSAREFGLATNGAGQEESPEALSLAPGDLPEREALQRLGTGIAVSNLWYLNFSDRQACRITGMTRFATLWVEGGEAVAPLEVMRFDDSFLRMAGEGLVALGDRAERLPETSTYGERQLASVTTPGALVEGWRLTL